MSYKFKGKLNKNWIKFKILLGILFINSEKSDHYYFNNNYYIFFSLMSLIKIRKELGKKVRKGFRSIRCKRRFQKINKKIFEKS